MQSVLKFQPCHVSADIAFYPRRIEMESEAGYVKRYTIGFTNDLDARRLLNFLHQG